MTGDTEMPNIPDAPACGLCKDGRPCICTPTERAVRAWMDEKMKTTPMTPDQRAWCLSQIADVKGYDAETYKDAKDDILALTVMNAWHDYIMDKRA